MRVIVAGGGIGGLAVAQGLARRGVEVRVLERDTDLAATGGYKLHLGPAACASVREVLADPLWEALRASAVRTQGFEIAVRDHRGRLLASGDEEQEGESLDIDRITLRLILAAGLGARLRTGITCTAYRETDQGVVVISSTGEEISGDALVIADGARSSLARRLTGAATTRETGLAGIAGRTPVAVLGRDSRELLQGRPMLGIGPGGVGMFASWHAPGRAEPSVAATRDPVVIWGMIATTAQLPDRLDSFSGGALALLAEHLLVRHRWIPSLTTLPTRSVSSSVAGFQFLATDPDTIAEWVPHRVTALGDAAHAMPPTGGRGAATAIRDAAHLAAGLSHAATGRTSIPLAMQESLTVMQTYAPQAVRDSLQPVRWITAGAHPVGRAIGAVGLPLLASLAAVRRRSGRKP